MCTPLVPLHAVRARSPSGKSSGQSLVEFAIVVPALLVVLLVAVDFGRVYLGWVDLTNVARIGANFAAGNPDAWQGSGNAAVQLRYRQLMARDAQGIDCTLPTPLPEPTFLDGSYAVGSRVQVQLSCGFQTLFIGGILDVGERLGLLPNPPEDFKDNALTVTSNAVFTIRFGSPDSGVIGGNAPSPSPTPGPTSAPTPTAGPTNSPSPAPTGTSGPTPTPGSSATPAPSATPGVTVVSFYGTPTSTDSSGGGSDGTQIIGVPQLWVTFYNTTTGDQGACTWSFGDGGSSNACSATVSYGYAAHGTYSVSLTVDGQTVSRFNYVLSSCKVPSFAGVRKNEAPASWVAAGFSSGNMTTLNGTGNYKIAYQSLVGGLVNPPGGCSGATITVGP